MRLFDRIKDPMQGTAQVVSSSHLDPHAVSQNVEMTLVVQAMGVEPFDLKHRCMCSAKRWPFPGQTLPVTFDANHHDRLKVEWDQVPASPDTAQQQADAMVEQLKAQRGAAAPPPVPGMPPAGQPIPGTE